MNWARIRGIIATIKNGYNGIEASTIIGERERALLYALNATEFGGLFVFVCGLFYPPIGDTITSIVDNVCGVFDKGPLCPEQQRVGIGIGIRVGAPFGMIMAMVYVYHKYVVLLQIIYFYIEILFVKEENNMFGVWERKIERCFVLLSSSITKHKHITYTFNKTTQP